VVAANLFDVGMVQQINISASQAVLTLLVCCDYELQMFHPRAGLSVAPAKAKQWCTCCCCCCCFCVLQANPGATLLHDNLHQFLRTHSHSAKRHMWTPAGTAAAITAFGGTTATMRVSQCSGFMSSEHC
jgi:hypothetical protein